MEPLSAAASVVGIIEAALRTTSVLVKYTRDTKNASSDRKMLADESVILSRLLERLKERAQAAQHDDTWLADHNDIVKHFEAAYEDLAASLRLDSNTGKVKEDSKFKALISSAKWSFSKAEVFSLLERITRLQQYANVLFVDNQQ